MTGTPGALTRDAFLGGRLQLWQPDKGYRAGTDPVLLAACVPAEPGQSVLDLGCGAGAAALCLAARVPGLSLAGVERQPAYAALARRNAAGNGVAMEVFETDLEALPPALRQRQFDHVIANPPYYDPARRTGARDRGRESALAEETPLTRWIETAARRLAPHGLLHVIQRTARLPDLLSACSGRLGSVEILPLAPRAGRAPHTLILRARKGGRGEFVLHAPRVLHEGAQHDRDGDSYAPEIAAVLRNAEALAWPNPRR